MGRRPPSNESPVSLFPFLSILACVIGSLVLLIAALALSQMGTPSDDEAVRRAEEYVTLEKRRALLEEENKALLARQGVAGTLQAEIQALTTEWEALARVPEIDPAILPPLRENVDALTEEEKALLEEIARREEILARMQAELARRLEAPKAGFIRVQPSGSGLLAASTPFYIETTGAGISVHTRAGKRDFTAAEITNHKDMKQFWANLEANSRAMLIFLIREDGAGTFQRASGEADKRNIAFGKIPVPGEGQLDLGILLR